MGEVSVDNLDCSDGEFDFLDMSFSDSLALDLDSLGGDFDIVELDLDRQEGVLDRSTPH